MAKRKKKTLSLREYYKTDHWKRLRNKLAFGDDAHCEICGAHRWEVYKRGPKKGQRKSKAVNHIHLHHKNYDNMLNEGKDDLMLLCNSCHKFGHTLERMKNKLPMYKDMYEQFKSKTGWDYKSR